MLSKLVSPEFAYIKAIPNNIKQDDKPPKRKYFKPALVEDSEFLSKVARRYRPNDCNSKAK